MSCVSLRLKLSVLAALEDSIALGLSRIMGPAGSGRAAAPPDAGSPSAPAFNAASAAPSVVPSPSHEVAASLLRSASLRAASPRTRTRSRSPAPLPKRAPRRSFSVASGLRGSVALAEAGLVTGLATKCCPPVPPPQPFPRFSCSSTLPQVARSHLPTSPCPLHPLPRPPKPPVLRKPRPTPMMNGTLSSTLSSTLTASPRLLVAPRPPSPSRPTPLVLVGVLATSDAVVSTKPPSAPCGGKFDLLSPALCASSAGLASLFVGSSWVRAHFRGSWECVGGCGPFSVGLVQDVGSLWCLPRWLWQKRLFGISENMEKPNKYHIAPRNWLCEAGLIMVVNLTGAGSSQGQDLPLLVVTPPSWRETLTFTTHADNQPGVLIQRTSVAGLRRSQ